MATLKDRVLESLKNIGKWSTAKEVLNIWFKNADKKYANDVKNGLNDICDNVILDEDEIEEYCVNNNIPYE